MTEKAYSRNDENYYEDLSEVLAAMEDDGDLEPGAVIWEADKVQRTASYYAGNAADCIKEQIQDQAWQDADEFAEGFADDVPAEKWDELESLINQWLDTNVPVRFWTVANVRKIEVTEQMILDYRDVTTPGVSAPGNGQS